jgi:AraC-like DNA-binding protein
MTSGANPLTSRATPAARSPEEPTLPAVFVNSALAALERTGWDVGSLLGESGLVPPAVGDPDARVSCRTWGGLMQRLQRARPSRNLAVEVAAATPIGAYPLLDYLVLTSETVGAALHQLARYVELILRVNGWKIDDQDDPVRAEVTGAGDIFGIEYAIAIAVCHLREETEGRFVPISISLTHHPADAAEMSRRLSCPVHPGGSWNGFLLTRDMCAVKLRRRDPVLRDVLERQAGEYERSPGTDAPQSRVCRALSMRMTGKPLGIAEVARDLGMSPRTLQRQLAASGQSFNALLDATRRRAAEQYLSDARLSIAEVAYLLGYSEPAAFHRAFRRWTRMTPQAFRRDAAHA